MTFFHLSSKKKNNKKGKILSPHDVCDIEKYLANIYINKKEK